MNTPTIRGLARSVILRFVYSGMIVQINHEPLIAPKVTPVTHVDWEVVRTGQEACGTRTGEHLELEKAA